MLLLYTPYTRARVCVNFMPVSLCEPDAITVVVVVVGVNIIVIIPTLLVGWDSKAIIFSRLVAFDYRNLIKF